MRCYLETTQQQKGLVECLPSKCEVLNSNLSTTKKKSIKNPKQKVENNNYQSLERVCVCGGREWKEMVSRFRVCAAIYEMEFTTLYSSIKPWFTGIG
jgi:hypothetical protein